MECGEGLFDFVDDVGVDEVESYYLVGVLGLGVGFDGGECDGGGFDYEVEVFEFVEGVCGCVLVVIEGDDDV